MEADRAGSTDSFFEDCLYSSAADFLQALTPWSKRFEAFSPGSVLFRGHGDSSWQLIPAAYRPEGRQHLRKLVFCPRSHASVSGTELYQAYIELNAVRCFSSVAGGAGLNVPGVDAEVDLALDTLTTRLHDALVAVESSDDNKAADQIERAAAILGSTWPAQRVLQAIAIAQHHGVPTRLLDWTFDARIAAYFAGESQLLAQQGHPSGMRRDRAKEICVWAAFRNKEYSHFRDNTVPGFMPAPQLASLPNTGNSYLVSQSGTFTFDRYRYSPIKENAYRMPLEIRDPDERTPTFQRLIKMRLPSSEAKQLMWLLGKDGIDACKVYPSFEGVAKTLRQAAEMMPKWRSSK